MEEKDLKTVQIELDKINKVKDKIILLIQKVLIEKSRLERYLEDDVDAETEIKINKQLKILEAKKDNLYKVEHELEDERKKVSEPIMRNIAEKVIGNYYRIYHDYYIKIVGIKRYHDGFVIMDVIICDFEKNTIDDGGYYYYKLDGCKLLTKKQFNERVENHIHFLQNRIESFTNAIAD